MRVNLNSWRFPIFCLNPFNSNFLSIPTSFQFQFYLNPNFLSIPTFTQFQLSLNFNLTSNSVFSEGFIQIDSCQILWLRKRTLSSFTSKGSFLFLSEMQFLVEMPIFFSFVGMHLPRLGLLKWGMSIKLRSGGAVIQTAAINMLKIYKQVKTINN